MLRRTSGGGGGRNLPIVNHCISVFFKVFFQERLVSMKESKFIHV